MAAVESVGVSQVLATPGACGTWLQATDDPGQIIQAGADRRSASAPAHHLPGPGATATPPSVSSRPANGNHKPCASAK